jgi:hypothetical protein
MPPFLFSRTSSSNEAHYPSKHHNEQKESVKAIIPENKLPFIELKSE